MFGLVVIEGMTLSGHPWIINEIIKRFMSVFALQKSAPPSGHEAF